MGENVAIMTAPDLGLVASKAPAFAQGHAVWRQELASDIAATLQAQAGPHESDGWLTRPAILRRVATLMGASIPATTDRIIAVGDAAEILGAAIALETGIPFCVANPDAVKTEFLPLGTLHAGERVAVVSLHLDAPNLFDRLAQLEVAVIVWRALLPRAADAPLLASDARLAVELSDVGLVAEVREGGGAA